MKQKSIAGLSIILFLTACSPRDILSRRLAADLIAASDAFKTTQQYTLQTGILANKDYVSPEYLVLQHHGWISASAANCSQGLGPPPCWDVILTPSGVETVRAVIAPEEPNRATFALPVAKRQLIAVTGISKQGIVADIDFTWKWVPLNEIGAALYSGDVHYRSTVRFREYDDGWRIVQSSPQPPQNLDDALKNAEPAP
ncbi:MAG TPA: hypothetical protein VMH04_00550 [Candidatus Solibacter sp.]|nr:hypothetical protein [Candidatus Solibacter sp.]